MFRKLQSLVIALSAWDMSEKSLLTHVRKNDDTRNIEGLLKRGFDTNVSELGITPLMYAAGNGNANTLSILLSYGARADVQDTWGNTALHYAAGVNNSQIPLFGKRFYANEKGGGHSVPKDADYKNCIVLLCEKRGGTINVGNKSGNTALMEAVGYPEHIKILLTFSPDLQARNNKDDTALGIARKYGMTVTEKLLIDAGARN